MDKSREITSETQPKSDGMEIFSAKFSIGDVVRHRFHGFRGVIYDVDPLFNNTEEWYQSIPPESRPSKDQPFYHLLAENEDSTYLAYVSEQNLVPDHESGPVAHPDASSYFHLSESGTYLIRQPRH